MKRLSVLFICLFLAGSVGAATIDTFEGQAVTDAKTIESVNTADTIEGQTIVSSCTAACNDAGIKLFLTCESTDDPYSINNTQDCVSGEDYSAAVDDIDHDSSAIVNADAKKVGTNGCDMPTASDRFYQNANVADVADGGNDGKVAFWFRVDANWTDERPLFILKDGGTNELTVRLEGTDELKVCWNDSADECEATSGWNGVIDTWYFVEVGWDENDDKLYLEIDNVSQIDEANTMDAITFTRWFLGDLDNIAGDVHADVLVISDDEADDLYPYRDDTGYATCN
jgi:hypothetical protein